MRILPSSLIIFIITTNLFPQSINWSRVYHDDYGRPLYTGGASYSAPTFADIDGDGDQDCFIGCQNGTIWFFENVGAPDSAAWHFVTENYDHTFFDYFRYSNVSFADIDRDGDMDMFVGGETLLNPSNYGIHFFRNDGNPSTPNWIFVTQKYHDIRIDIDPGNPGYIYAHNQFLDIDNDTDLDLFFISYGGRIAFYENAGNDSLPVYMLITENMLNASFGNFQHIMEFADIDDDNDFDLFISGSVFYRNIGTPDSAIWNLDTYNYFNLNYPRGLAATDIDNDLDNDMFVGLRNGNIYLFENTGTPAAPQWEFTSHNPFSIDLGEYSNPSFIDIDRDGLLELFITHEFTYGTFVFDESIWFYENDGTPTHPKWQLVTTIYDSIRYPSMSGLSFVDIDNDMDYDMFLGDFDPNNHRSHIIFHENFGDHTTPNFSQTGQVILILNDRIGLHPSLIDIDSDGDYDMFISERDSYAGYSALLHFYRNDGDIYQPVWTHISSEPYPRGIVTFMDEDNDGDQDMIFGDWTGDSKLALLENIGDSSNFNFQFVTSNYAGIDLRPDTGSFYINAELSPEFADIDSDGDLDMIIGERVGGINVFINDGLTSIIKNNTPPPREFEITTYNYPNPFNSTTTIFYSIPFSQEYLFYGYTLTITIYNCTGQIVREFRQIEMNNPPNRIVWNGTNNKGSSVSSGIYFYHIKINRGDRRGISDVRKIVKIN